MGRKPRIEYYGAIYHIIHRGNNKGFIFEESEEKMELLKIIGEVKEIFDFNLLAYVIMDNHYHFIIKTHNIPISQIMHRINTRYAKYYNWKKERSGSPFESRYKGILVQNQIYLFTLIKYIHNNPVYASICSSMREYKWSSDVFYRMNLSNLVDIDELLEMFSSDRVQAIEKYKELMNGPLEDYRELNNKYEQEEIIGTEEFKESFKEDSKSKERISLDEILKSICIMSIDYELIKKGSRHKHLQNYKYEYAMEALNQGYTRAEISNNINISTKTLRNILLTSDLRCQAP